MYEDSWYNYIGELQQTQPTQQHKRVPSQSYGHRRRESLLQQPNVSTTSGRLGRSIENMRLTVFRGPLQPMRYLKTSTSC